MSRKNQKKFMLPYHHSKIFEKLSHKYNTPWKVQRLLHHLRYNKEEDGDTMHSALTAWQKKEAHCLEAAFIAAAILEHQGYPPLVVSLESQDGLDHILFVFKEITGWGAIARSREQGLHGRAPRFKTLKDLAMTYVEPFVDNTGKLLSYGLANLDDSKADWRFSPKNVWKAEKFLIDLRHHRLKYPERVYLKALERFKKTDLPCLPKSYWW
jgi:hypothetical protein